MRNYLHLLRTVGSSKHVQFGNPLYLIGSLLVFAAAADAASAQMAPTAILTQSPTCEQGLRDIFDESNKYTGTQKKLSINAMYDLHNNFWYGKHTMYEVLFQSWYYSNGRQVRADPQLVRYCIMANDGSLLGIEAELQKE